MSCLYTKELETAKKTSKYDGQLDKKTVLITGATGLIGRQFVDLLMYIGTIKVVAVGRNQEKLNTVFAKYIGNKNFEAVTLDDETKPKYNKSVDCIVHCAAVTRSDKFRDEPQATLLSNIEGCVNILSYALKQKASRAIFLSSVEVYGNPKPDQKEFFEDDLGFIDLSDPRSAYPESKRCGELLFTLYNAQKNIDCLTVRLPRTLGVTMEHDDKRAASDFLYSAVIKKDIVLATKGTQKVSFCYNADASAALLLVLVYGERGQTYNAASNDSTVTIYEYAKLCAQIGGMEVLTKEQSAESLGYNKFSHAILNTDKIRKLGFEPSYTLKSGIESAIAILRETSKN